MQPMIGGIIEIRGTLSELFALDAAENSIASTLMAFPTPFGEYLENLPPLIEIESSQHQWQRMPFHLLR